MSIQRVFSRAHSASSKQLARGTRMIPRPKNLERKKQKFLKNILPNARSRGKTSGVCVQINGEWSSGKTLFLAFIAEERYEANGVGGVCNYPLKTPGYERLNDDFTRIDGDSGDTLYGIEALSEVYDSIIQIDELQRYIDSYMSRSQENLFISNLTSDFGKQGNDFYYTNQHYNAAPTRVRVNISFVVYPQYDEESGWVHVYVFHSILKFLWKDPFWYFGFYAPDYWNAYDTKYKVEDYTLKFRTEPYIKKFFKWLPSRNIDEDIIYEMRTKKLRDTFKLFNQTEGEKLSSSEISLVITDMEYKELWVGTG